MLRAELKVVGGKHDGKVIPLTTKKFLIGREEDCHLRPNSDMVSRHHCVFTLDDFSLRLRDLGSTNGTQINGERLRGQAVLNSGDTVSIGNLGFEVRIDKSTPVEPVEHSSGGPETVELSASDTMSMRALENGAAASGDTTLMNASAIESAAAELEPQPAAVPAVEEVVPAVVEQPAPEQPAVLQPVSDQTAPAPAARQVPPNAEQQPVYAPQPGMDPAYAQPAPGYMPMQPMGYPQPGMVYPQQQQGYGYPQQGYMPQPGMPQPGMQQPGVPQPGMAYPQQAYGMPQQMPAQPEAEPPAEPTSSRKIPVAPIKLPPPESTGAR